MFNNLLMTGKANISTVRSIIKTNDRIREIAFGKRNLLKHEFDETTDLILNILTQDVPKLNDLRIYEHCSVVTRLYAIYESFVEDLIRDWLILLPELYPTYSDLDKTIRYTHKIGVGRLLQIIKDKDSNENDNSRYSSLSVQKILQDLSNGENGVDKYELCPDAFLFHQQNLRIDTLNELLKNAGIPNELLKSGGISEAWNWVIEHRNIKYFLQEIRGNQSSADKELNTFISYRNDAAHNTKINDFLPSKELLELCDFVEALCQALIELVTYQVIQNKKSLGQAQIIGKITEWFKKPQAGVATTVEDCFLSVGSNLFLVGKSYCQLVKIESIYDHDISVEELPVIPGMEVGLKFDVDARKDLQLYQLDFYPR